MADPGISRLAEWLTARDQRSWMRLPHPDGRVRVMVIGDIETMAPFGVGSGETLAEAIEAALNRYEVENGKA